MTGRVGLTAIVVTSLATALAGCSGQSGGSVGPTSGAALPSSGGTGSAAAAKVLEGSAQQLHQQVDSAAQPIQSGVTDRRVTVDDAGPCEIGVPAAWPERWGYGVVLTLRSTDAKGAGTAMQRQLQGQGWTVRVHDSTTDVIDFDARKGGMLLRVSGEPNPAAVTVEGYSACIAGDGKTVVG